MKIKFLDKIFTNIPLIKEEQEKFDILLYGQILKDNAPWPEGPKAKLRRQLKN